MHIGKMIDSKYLKKEDVGQGKLVTIKALKRENVAREDEEPDYKYIMSFRDIDKGMVLNSTNIQLCALACGSQETDDWIGKQIVLFEDPSVSFGGKLVGGIRIRAPRKPAQAQDTRAAADERMAKEAGDRAAARDDFEDSEVPF